MPQRPEDQDRDHFREALARWRLDLRTEVKKSSSLPTAMFDACDPMLETRLAETARAMLARLQGTEPPTDTATGPPVEKRLEKVTLGDLQKLPNQIAATGTGPVDLEEGLFAEYLAILVDTCCNATGASQQGAAHLLARDFELSATTDIDTLNELLARQVRETPERFAKAAAWTDDELATACQRVAAALVLHTTPPAGGSS